MDIGKIMDAVKENALLFVQGVVVAIGIYIAILAINGLLALVGLGVALVLPEWLAFAGNPFVLGPVLGVLNVVKKFIFG